MKPAVLDEGQTAFDRFKRAMQTIVNVPKAAALESSKKSTKEKKNASKRTQ